MEETLKKLTSIMRQVFEDSNIVVSPQMSAKDVEKWTSKTNILLITEVEKSFGFKFPFGDLMSLKNVGDLINVIEKNKTI